MLDSVCDEALFLGALSRNTLLARIGPESATVVTNTNRTEIISYYWFTYRALNITMSFALFQLLTSYSHKYT